MADYFESKCSVNHEMEVKLKVYTLTSVFC